VKTKILYIHHGKGIGGAPLSLLYLIEKLDRSIFDPKVIFLTDGEVVNLFKEKNISVRALNLKNYLFLHLEPTWYRFYNAIGFIKALLNQFLVVRKVSIKILKEEQPAILHLNSLFLITWAISAKKLKIPTVIHVREPLAEGYLGLRKKIFGYLLDKYCDKIIAISEDNLKRLALKGDHGTVIYNFVDFNKFDRNKSYSSDFEKQNDTKYVLYLGGRIKYKGFHEVVGCLKYLDRQIKIVFAGYYGFNRWLKFYNPIKYYYLQKMKNSTNSIMVGLSNNIPSVISNSDIVIFPSNKPHFARPVIEAFAMGKTVIVSDVEGNSEIVKDGINGLFFKSKSAKDLAVKINYLANNRDIRQMYGDNGYEFACLNFDASINVPKTASNYYTILNTLNNKCK